MRGNKSWKSVVLKWFHEDFLTWQRQTIPFSKNRILKCPRKLKIFSRHVWRHLNLCQKKGLITSLKNCEYANIVYNSWTQDVSHFPWKSILCLCTGGFRFPHHTCVSLIQDDDWLPRVTKSSRVSYSDLKVSTEKLSNCTNIMQTSKWGDNERNTFLSRGGALTSRWASSWIQT